MPGACDVWLWATGAAWGGLQEDHECFDVLDVAERRRLDRFRYLADRREFLHSHSVVRAILSRYAAIDPRQWAFENGQFGKPEVRSPQLARGIKFNLSHTREISGCVVTRGRECGVDLERVRVLDDLDGVAKKVFSLEERALLSSKVGRERVLLFFRIWTLKEAYIKAVGIGMSENLTEFSIFPLSGGDGKLVGFSEGDSLREWSIYWTDLFGGFCAAVAVRGTVRPDAVTMRLIDGATMIRSGCGRGAE